MNANSFLSAPQAFAEKSVVLGTAGHIDHGKTTLVFALTGTDTDRLPEEKSRGITIDLGFASLQMKDRDGRPVEIGLVDVPGHHAFVRNMLAGAGGIDCVMLVIAADEGIKPQTVEHLAICTLLGIRHGLIAVTKGDAVSAERLAEVCEQIAAFVEGTFLQGAPMLAVSALTREGIPQLKAELAKLALDVAVRSNKFVPRLPLDRVFSVRGFGTVVTGTLQSGVVRSDDMLELQPQQRLVRVRGVQVHGKARPEAHAPGRVALNLAGIDTNDLGRGDTLVPPHTLAAVSTIDAEFTMLEGAPALKHRSRVRLHAYTSETLATVLLYQSESASSAGPVLARLRLAKPIVLAPGDRFVIRQASPAVTIGGGLVLDAQPLPKARKRTTQDWLLQLRAAAIPDQLLLRVQRRGIDGISVRQLVAETGFTAEAIRTLLTPMVENALLVQEEQKDVLRQHFITSDSFAGSRERVLGELRRAKDKRVSRAELQSKIRLPEWVFDLAVQNLQHEGSVELRRDGLALPGQGVPPTAQSARAATVEAFYAAAGLASPITSEAAVKLGIAQNELRGILTDLLRAKRLVRLGADYLLVHTGALEQLTQKLREHQGERFDVARFKSFTNLTRKHAIPLLEYLDGARLTRNEKGIRTVL